MSFRNFLDEHRDEIEAAPASQVVVMLYDQAIEQLELAIAAIKAGDIAARCNATMMTAEIVASLHGALDFVQGGELARHLSRVYRCVLGWLPRINRDNDAQAAARLIGLLRPMGNAWRLADARIAARNDLADDVGMPAVA